MKSFAHTIRSLTLLLPALALAAMTLLTGCSSALISGVDPRTDCSQAKSLPQAKQPLILAVAVHQGAPAPGIPPAVEPLIKATLTAGQAVRVIAIDGTPAPVPLPELSISTKSCDGYTTSLTTAINRLGAAIRTATADSDGNDLYQAIAVAADEARGLTPTGKATIMILDSGLADTGPLDFTIPGMTLTNPKTAARYAANESKLDLRGLIFILALGYTAPPQQPLSGTERDTVTATWGATLTRQHATVTILHTPRPATGPDTRYTVNLAPVASTTAFTPPAPNTKPVTSVFSESQIRFLPDSTQLANPTAARQALSKVTRWLTVDSRHQITITGTTASAGTETGRLALSRARATTIKTLILTTQPEIQPTQIHTRGVGTHFPDYLNDRNTDGTLNPLKAAANRTVRVTATI